MATKERENSKVLEPGSGLGVARPERVKLSAEETLERMEAFEEERKEALIAAVRKGKD